MKTSYLDIIKFLLWTFFNFKFVTSSGSDKFDEREASRNEINIFGPDIIYENIITYGEKVDDEREQIEAFIGILNFIESISQETLKKPAEKQKVSIVTWLSAINTLAEESYVKQQQQHQVKLIKEKLEKEIIYTSDAVIVNEKEKEEEEVQNYSDFDFDAPTLKPDLYKSVEDETLNYFKTYKYAQFSIDNKQKEFGHYDHFNNYQNSFSFPIKSKMLKGFDDEKEEIKGKEEGEKINLFLDQSRLKNDIFLSQAAQIEDDEYDDDDDNFRSCYQEVYSNIESNNDLKAYNDNGIDSVAQTTTKQMDPEVMEQLQQQLLSQLLGNIQQKFPNLAPLVQISDENGNNQSLSLLDIDALPKMDTASLIEYLKKSALPKLINSAIKGKTGIDVLKSLSMSLKVVNESLGVVEVILKMIIKVIREVRSVTLVAAEIVADMARDEDVKPLSDLSVSLDALKQQTKEKSRLKGITKTFRKGLGASDEDEIVVDAKINAFDFSIQAAFSTARDYSNELKKLPDTLLLSLIHTIFTELENKNGAIRGALVKKKHKNLLKRQQSVQEAVELIFEATIGADSNAADHLSEFPASIFTNILLALISSINLDPVDLTVHINKVTAWIKPMMRIFDQNQQLSLLNHFLNDVSIESNLSEIMNTKSLFNKSSSSTKSFTKSLTKSLPKSLPKSLTKSLSFSQSNTKEENEEKENEKNSKNTKIPSFRCNFIKSNNSKKKV